MKTHIFFIYMLLTSSGLLSQINPYTSKIELTPVGINAVFLDNTLDEDEHSDIYKFTARKLLLDKNIHYVVFEELPQKLYKLTKNNEVKEWNIIVNQENYFILCPDEIKGECSCKDNIYIYIPDKNIIKYINSFLPVFPKRDLAKALNKYTEDKIDYRDFEKYCDMIQYLKQI